MPAKTKTPQQAASMLLIFFLSASAALAQPNLRNAYAINNGGDSLRGLVDYKEWGSTPKQFSFRIADNDQPQAFTTRDIRSITIANRETYERFYVSITMNQTDLQRIEFANDTTIRQDTIFLKELVKGNNLSLYAYRDYLKERFYILRAGQTTPVELRYEVQKEGLQTLNIDIYKTQLEQVAATFPSYSLATQRKIQGLSYSPQSLTRFVAGLNEQPKVGRDEQVRRGRFVVQAGINYSTLNYSGESQITANGLNSSGQPQFTKRSTGSVMPVLAAGYDYFFQPAIRRFYFRTSLEIAAVRSEVSSFYKFPAPYDEELTNEYQLTAVTLAVHPQLIYHFYNKPAASLYFGTGLSLNQVFYIKNRLVQITNKQGPGYANKTTNDALNYKERLLVPSFSLGAAFGERIGLMATWAIPAEMIRGDAEGRKTWVTMNAIHIKGSYSF